MEIVFLIVGIVVGGVIGFISAQFFIIKRYIPKEEFLELKKNSVSKELHDAAMQPLLDVKGLLQKEQDNVNELRETILQLTKESEQKLSPDDVKSKYVPKESFDLLDEKIKRYESVDLPAKDKNILELSEKLVALEKKEEYLEEKLTTFNRELDKLHSQTLEQFKNLATDVLEEKKKIFVDANKNELANILTPLQTNLAEFKQKVEATRSDDIRDLTSLKKEIELLHKLNTELSEDAKSLVSALKSDVKMQGNWGEDRLNLILEVEGLQKYIDYTREESFRDEEEKNKRPDFILKLPNQKHIIIDSKVSLTSYVNYFNCASPEEKNAHLKGHLKSVTDHIDRLADKNYQTLAGLTTPDYVFMFMPIESALTLALNQNPEIFNNALKRKIILITPTTLVATLKIVKILWQKENQVKNVEEIFRQCGILYDKFSTFLEEMDSIESGLNTAIGAHKKAVNRLTEGTRKGDTIIGKFEIIKGLEAKTTKSISKKYLDRVDLLGSGDEIPESSTQAIDGPVKQEKKTNEDNDVSTWEI